MRADVARVAQAHVLLLDVDDARVLRGDLLRVVGRSVVHEDDLVVRIIDLHERGEAVVERAGAVVGADDDRDLRVARQLHARGHRFLAAPLALDRLERFLRLAIARHEAEGPVRDLHAAGEPFVGPRIDHRARQPAAHHAVDMPREHVRLLLLGMANRVHAEFAEHERLVVREILQAQQVLLEVALVVQVNVEGEEVDVLRQQVLGRRITRVGIKRTRIDRAGEIDELLEEFRDAADAEPAHHGGGDFVADEVAEDRRMALVTRDALADRLDHLRANAAIVEKLDVLGPRNGDERAQTRLLQRVEKPARRHVINAQRVHSQFAHLRQILLHAPGRADVVAVRIGAERAVGDPLEEELALALKEEFRAHAEALGNIGGHGGALSISRSARMTRNRGRGRRQRADFPTARMSPTLTPRASAALPRLMATSSRSSASKNATYSPRGTSVYVVARRTGTDLPPAISEKAAPGAMPSRSKSAVWKSSVMFP